MIFFSIFTSQNIDTTNPGEMPNNWFRFKQFTIEQEKAAMKVGTDGVLLGAWASIPEPGSRVLDVGTGTGLIALMMAQRSKNVKVDALEIDPSSARQALENFQNSPWKDSIQCIPSSFQEYASKCKDSYDLIICNPPYFSASFKTPSRAKNLARHDDSLSLEELFRDSVALMKKASKLSLILPADKEAMALKLATTNELYCKYLTRVFPAPGKPVRRVLLEFSNTPSQIFEDELTIETGTRHSYSDAFKKLVEAFYL